VSRGTIVESAGHLPHCSQLTVVAHSLLEVMSHDSVKLVRPVTRGGEEPVSDALVEQGAVALRQRRIGSVSN